ncbi:MAG: hypothetical protein Q8Q31_02055 [Nanoarchaeota archaeon]|nr:hypothetical protein [Nanoarchaeota archaeon]
MIIVVRISGLVEIPQEVKESLYRLRLRRKYTAVLLEETKENESLLQQLRNFIAYGKLNQETLSLLVEKRAMPLPGKKIEAKKVVEGLDKKSLEELGVKPFFRLHPPRGGIDSKTHFPIRKGVLGDNKEKINDLIRRML